MRKSNAKLPKGSEAPTTTGKENKHKQTNEMARSMLSQLQNFCENVMSASGRERKSETTKRERVIEIEIEVEIKALAIAQSGKTVHTARVHVAPKCVFVLRGACVVVLKSACCRHNSRDLQKTLNTDHRWYDHKWHTPIPKQANHTEPNRTEKATE